MKTPLLVGAAIALILGQESAKPRVRLADGSPVGVRLLNLISSETSKPGDAVRLAVVGDVAVDGTVVIKDGTPASGTVVEARPGTLRGRAPRLAFVVSETRSVSGETIRLRSPQIEPFRGRRAYLLWIAQGSKFEAFVDGDHTVTGQVPAATRPQGAARVEIPVGIQADVITNEDVLKLLAAGIGEEVVIAKIQTSRPAFRLNANDLIELKKNGVSDRVLAAMIKAAGRSQ